MVAFVVDTFVGVIGVALLEAWGAFTVSLLAEGLTLGLRLVVDALTAANEDDGLGAGRGSLRALLP